MEAFIMVGPPGCGKSTFINEVLGLAALSTDLFFENKAHFDKISYNEAWQKYNFSEAQAFLDKDLEDFIKHHDSFAWDQTQMSRKSRAKNIARIPKTYTIHCINFIITNHDEWMRRVNSRPGKTIPQHVLDSMMNSYEQPAYYEGFSKIWNVVV